MLEERRRSRLKTAARKAMAPKTPLVPKAPKVPKAKEYWQTFQVRGKDWLVRTTGDIPRELLERAFEETLIRRPQDAFLQLTRTLPVFPLLNIEDGMKTKVFTTSTHSSGRTMYHCFVYLQFCERLVLRMLSCWDNKHCDD